jgi:hypothetical protein
MSDLAALLGRHGFSVVRRYARHDGRRLVDTYFDDESIDQPGTSDTLLGYALAKGGSISGRSMQFYPREAADLVPLFSCPEHAVEQAQQYIARSIADATRGPSRPGVKVVEIDVPLCQPRPNGKSGGKVAVNLDIDEVQIVDGILEAARDNNLWLRNGSPVDSRADVVRLLCQLILDRVGANPL